MTPEERALEFSREAFKAFGLPDVQMSEYASTIAALLRQAENEALERAALYFENDTSIWDGLESGIAEAIRASKHPA